MIPKEFLFGQSRLVEHINEFLLNEILFNLAKCQESRLDARHHLGSGDEQTSRK